MSKWCHQHADINPHILRACGATVVLFGQCSDPDCLLLVNPYPPGSAAYHASAAAIDYWYSATIVGSDQVYPPHPAMALVEWDDRSVFAAFRNAA